MTIDDLPVGDIERGYYEKGNSTNKTSIDSPDNASKDDNASFGSKANKNKDLIWSGINLKLMEKRGKDDIKLNILKDVWGKAEAGKTTAIMGASGAGSKFFISRNEEYPM